jgi:hypothetical protein
MNTDVFAPKRARTYKEYRMANTRDPDPATADQGGRSMPMDPGEPIQTLTDDEIRVRAYSLYEQRGAIDGHAEDDWFEAEADLVPEKLRDSIL